MHKTSFLLLALALSSAARAADQYSEKLTLVCHLAGGAGEECRFSSKDELGFCVKSLTFIDRDEKQGTAAMRAEIYDKENGKARMIRFGVSKFDATLTSLKGRWAANQASLILRLSSSDDAEITGSAHFILDGTPIKPTSRPTIFKSVECEKVGGAKK